MDSMSLIAGMDFNKIGGKMKDKCVYCGKETQYEKETPIQQRKYYIEGAGQLCPLCFIEIYGYKE